MAIDQTVKLNGFLPNHESDSYDTWCGGCQGSSVHDAREISATEPSKSVKDGGRHGVRKLLTFFASVERTIVQIVASKLSIMTKQASAVG